MAKGSGPDVSARPTWIISRHELVCLSEYIRFWSNMSSAFKHVKLMLQFMPGTDVSMQIEDQLAKHAVTAEEGTGRGTITARRYWYWTFSERYLLQHVGQPSHAY